MHFDPGTIIAIVAALFFYLRLFVLQRQRANTSGRKKGTVGQASPWVVVRYQYLVGSGVLLIGIGAVISAVPGWSGTAGPWWWVPVTAGIVLMGFGIG